MMRFSSRKIGVAKYIGAALVLLAHASLAGAADPVGSDRRILGSSVERVGGGTKLQVCHIYEECDAQGCRRERICYPCPPVGCFY